MSEVREKAQRAKQCVSRLGTLSTAAKNAALQAIADALLQHSSTILKANEEDLARGREQGLSQALLDRLALNEQRIAAMAEGLREIVALTDPIGETLSSIKRPNGLSIQQVRVPLGLIGIIYEARPNVTVDAAGLCLKTGNAVLLRGGSSALSSNKAIISIIHDALEKTDIPPEAVQYIEDSNRSSVDEMLKLRGVLDCIIPRGGASLIRNVVENATVPVIETGSGICHTYIDADASPDMARAIAVNAKVQRPSVCNAMETLLVHRDFAAQHLKELAEELISKGVELKGCAASRALVPSMQEATEADYATEYNDYVLNVRIVDNLDAALSHISRFGTMHSECIITNNTEHARRFLQEVDAAAVYHNASTRFTDGFEFGFGAEIGISTQKLHARGPMGLPALTSTKYVIEGSGQIRE